MSWFMANTVAEANLITKLLPRISKLILHRGHINSCEPSGLLIVDEDVKLAISKQRLKAVMLAPNAKFVFNPAFLQQNAMLVFTSFTFQHQNMKFTSRLKLCQNTKYTSHFKNARPTFSLRSRQNMTFAFQF